ncbi:MAG TPA: hypothetical protein PK598_03975, partial [Thermoanaerobaculia bacterium]|nr:hypothetical protein [Thermoanaerobaculia bacterium]
MTGARKARPGVAAALFGLFVAAETFLFLAEGDRWAVLLFVTRETWLLVGLLWLRNLLLSAAAGLGAILLVRIAAEGRARDLSQPGLPRRREAAIVLLLLAGGVFLRWVDRSNTPPGVWHDVAYTLRPLLEDGWRNAALSGAWVGEDGPVTGAILGGPFLLLLAPAVAPFPAGDPQLLAVSAVPACLALAAGETLGVDLAGPIAVMVDEHADVGEDLARLRNLTAGY